MSIVRLRRSSNLLIVKPLTPELCRDLERTLSYTKKISLHGREAAEAQSSIRLEHRDLFRYSRERLITSIGFKARVEEVLRELQLPFEYKDLTPHPNPAVFDPSWVAVERYLKRKGTSFKVKQRELLETLVKEERGAIDCATGWGKSFLFQLIPLLFPKAKIDIVTASADVVRQIYYDVASTGVHVGQLGAGKRDPQARVVVVCGRSLHRCTFDDTDIVLADESQELAAESYLAQLANYSRARMYMFSATVGMRMDGSDLELEGCFGKTILKVPFDMAVKHKAVVPIRVKWVPVMSDYNPAKGTTGTIRNRRGIWRHGYRNRIIAETAKKFSDDAQVLIVVDKVEHALALKMYLPDYTLVYSEQGLTPLRRKELQRAGLQTDKEPVMTPQRRIWLKRQFESGELKKVIATSVWNRGVNFRKLATLIRADAGGSAINDTQIPGRVCRLSDGKEFGLVVDFMDQFDSGFRARAKRREKNYAANGWTQIMPTSKSRLRQQQLDG